MGDDPSVYLSPADEIAPLLPASASQLKKDENDSDEDDDSEEDEEDDLQFRRTRINNSRVEGESIKNSTNQQMLDVVSNNNNNKRKGNRRQQNNRNRNANNQNDGTSSFDENNPINIISAFNRTGKIYNKLRKNDAVKVIDTPSGRAGFVYQSGSNSGSSSNRNQDSSPSIKESNSNWEDSYSQSSQFVNRNANDVKLIPSDDNNHHHHSNNKKIMPVLTADGKIALVVRGDTSRQIFDDGQNNGSGNSVNTKKYEPITNLTSIITALNSNNNDNNNNNHKVNESVDINTELKAIQEENRRINRLDDFFASVTNKIKHIEEEIEHKLGINIEEEQEEVDDAEETGEGLQIDSMTTTSKTTTVESFFDNEDENRRDLLLINRPLSEVLGLPKKTHYHHPHDFLHTSAPEVNRRIINTAHRTSSQTEILSTASTTVTSTTAQTEEFDLESPEKINIAVIPRFDSELEERLFGKKKNREHMNNEIPNASGAISSIHCAMQVMVAVACACTVLGVLGNYYRIPLTNHFRDVYW